MGFFGRIWKGIKRGVKAVVDFFDGFLEDIGVDDLADALAKLEQLANDDVVNLWTHLTTTNVDNRVLEVLKKYIPKYLDQLEGVDTGRCILSNGKPDLNCYLEVYIEAFSGKSVKVLLLELMVFVAGRLGWILPKRQERALLEAQLEVACLRCTA